MANPPTRARIERRQRQPAAQSGASTASAAARDANGRARDESSIPDADRVVIENISPEVDCGRFPAKAAVGDCFTVEADIFADGHDKIGAALLIRRADETAWREAPTAFFDNDRWRGFALVEENARYVFTVIAWRDLFASWQDEVAKKHAAGVPVALELREGRALVERTLRDSKRADNADRAA